MRLLKIGHQMIQSVDAGDLQNFKKLFLEAADKEILYWHVTKCFKAAVKLKSYRFVECIIEDLDLPLTHVAFEGLLEEFLFGCK